MRIYVTQFFLFVLFTLTVYSYSQVDLNLTISSNPQYQSVQNQLTYLGYFNRPASTRIYIIILVSLFLFYIFFLLQASRHKLNKKMVIGLVSSSVFILLLAYPAFSHDIFNYMFDARIVTHYGQNPYLYRALDFPGDLWLRFMHWTHRYYPYGPVWLLVTIPVSFLGFGKFVSTLFGFKALFALIHTANTALIYVIAKRTRTTIPEYAAVFYALNPLILIESIVSPHNESLMLLFLLISIYFLVEKRKTLLSFIMLLLSMGVKYVTIILIPYWILKIRQPQNHLEGDRLKQSISHGSFQVKETTLLIFLLLIPVIYLSFLREPYPWYAVPVIGAASLLAAERWILYPVIGASFGLLLRYAPYLYFGDYSPQVRLWQSILLFTPLVISAGISFFTQLHKKIF